MNKKFTNANVTMSLNDYNDLMYRITALEDAISVSRPSWTTDYVEVRLDSEKVRPIIMVKLRALPYWHEYDFKSTFYDAVTTIGNLKPAPEPIDEETSAGLEGV